MKQITFISILVFATGFFACKKDSTPAAKDPVPVESVEQVAEMSQTLGWKVFREEQLARPDENVLISPFSIQTALNMATNGARGNTLAEILDLIGCTDCSVGDLNNQHRDLTTLLSEQSGHPTLTVANGYFYDKNRITVKAPFLDTLSAYYECTAQQVNFNTEQAALDQINGWVKTNTKGKIDKILDRITALDVAFLIDALHFKADWATGFDPQMTYVRPFTKPNGQVVQVEFVSADRNFTFATTPNFNLVDIPFRDSTYSLSFIQSAAANPDVNWRLNITPEVWKDMYTGIQYARAQVSFPKLKLAYENDLIPSLKNLGVEDAFHESTADFTDMGTAVKNIFINQIKHKAVLEVDEKGAEGAAVTSIGFGITSVPPTFRFDHPFVLVLRHIPTNTMIFAGFVADPEI